MPVRSRIKARDARRNHRFAGGRRGRLRPRCVWGGLECGAGVTCGVDRRALRFRSTFLPIKNVPCTIKRQCGHHGAAHARARSRRARVAGRAPAPLLRRSRASRAPVCSRRVRAPAGPHAGPVVAASCGAQRIARLPFVPHSSRVLRPAPAARWSVGRQTLLCGYRPRGAPVGAPP